MNAAMQSILDVLWNSRRNRWIFLGACGIVLLIVLYALARDPVELPSSFVAARSSASAVSREIVSLTGETNAKIREANSLDLRGDSEKARFLIRDARDANGLAYQRAFELSQYLQKLTESLQDVPSSHSQRLAYEAIAVELSLVSEFINYTQNLNTFLERLEQAIATGLSQDRTFAEATLRGVNDKASRINDLNEEFLAKMREFDESL